MGATVIRVSTLLLLVAGPVTAFAHHSNAEFDFDVIEEYEGHCQVEEKARVSFPSRPSLFRASGPFAPLRGIFLPCFETLRSISAVAKTST